MTPQKKNKDRPTIYDIAEKAEISYAAVSTILNSTRPHRYSEKTVARVKAAAAELGYTRNHFATVLKGGKTNCIGFMGEPMPNMAAFALYNLRIQAGIEQGLSDYDTTSYSLISFSANVKDSYERSMNLVSQRLVDGMIFNRFSHAIPEFEERLVPVLQKLSIPFVLVHATTREFPYPNVGLDNITGGRLAAEHFMKLGYTELGCYLLSPNSVRLSEPLTAYKETIAANGGTFDERFMFIPDFAREDRENAYQYEHDYFMNLNPLPRAIFIPDDFSAGNAQAAFRARGLRVPEDIAVLGFDDLNRFGPDAKTLSTLCHPYEEKGQAAFSMLAALLEGKETDTRKMVTPHLVIRTSCGGTPEHSG